MDKEYICKITGQECQHLLENECDFEIVTGKKCPIEKMETSAAEVAEMIHEYARAKAIMNEH